MIELYSGISVLKLHIFSFRTAYFKPAHLVQKCTYRTIRVKTDAAVGKLIVEEQKNHSFINFDLKLSLNIAIRFFQDCID